MGLPALPWWELCLLRTLRTRAPGLWGCIPAERRGVASVPASRETLKEGKMRIQRASHPPRASDEQRGPPALQQRQRLPAWALLDGALLAPPTGLLAQALFPHPVPWSHPLSRAYYPVPLPRAGAVLGSAPSHCPSLNPEDEHQWPTPLFHGSGQPPSESSILG